MAELELRVSELEPYRSVAFFHHLTMTKACGDTPAEEVKSCCASSDC